jgi:hypothetical protein
MKTHEYDEYINDNFISDCCGAPIVGEIIDDLGICSQCNEWSGVRQEPENEIE